MGPIFGQKWTSHVKSAKSRFQDDIKCKICPKEVWNFPEMFTHIFCIPPIWHKLCLGIHVFRVFNITLTYIWLYVKQKRVMGQLKNLMIKCFDFCRSSKKLSYWWGASGTACLVVPFSPVCVCWSCSFILRSQRKQGIIREVAIQQSTSNIHDM